MKEMWDKRYSLKEYVYGTTPNEFFKSSIEQYRVKGSILLPAEGEGRNAVFASKKGLEVVAFDISEEGRKKAQQLAEKEHVKIRYEVGDFMNMEFLDNSFDAAALIFAHFSPQLLSRYHQRISRLIKPEGLIILEGFSKRNLPLREKNPEIGGPKNIEMLFSIETIRHDFPQLEILQLEEVESKLNEGAFHQGVARLIRYVGRKKIS